MLMLYYKIPRDIDQTSHRDVLFVQPSKWSDHTTQREFQCTCNYQRVYLLHAILI